MHTSVFCMSGVHPPLTSVTKSVTTLGNVYLGSRPTFSEPVLRVLADAPAGCSLTMVFGRAPKRYVRAHFGVQKAKLWDFRTSDNIVVAVGTAGAALSSEGLQEEPVRELVTI